MDKITPLKRILFERQMKLKELEELTGIHGVSLSHIVNGKRVPTLENALKIARALDKSVEELWSYLLDEYDASPR